MTGLKNREQYRQLEIELEPESGRFINITKYLGEDPLSIEDAAFNLDTIEFTIVRGDSAWLMDTIMRGMRVRYKGGFLFDRQEWMFDGYVTDWTPIFPDNGNIKLQVLGMDKSWLLTRKKPGCVTYPVLKSSATIYERNFHFVDEIRLSEIVKGILAEYDDIKIGSFFIPEKRDILFTLLDPVTQNEDETDYAFLCRLLRGKVRQYESRYNNWVDEARRHGHCVFFMETGGTGEEPDTKLHVMPEQDLMDSANKSKIKYVYMSQETAAELVDADEYNPGSPDARMPILGVTVKDNLDNCYGDKLVIKETKKKKGKKKKAVTGSAMTVGEPAEVEETIEESEIIPPGGWAAWDIDEAAVKAAEDSGELKGVSILTVVKQWPWSRAKKYFKPRETVYESSSHAMGGEGVAQVGDDELLEDKTPEADNQASPGRKNAKGHGKGKSAEGARRGKKYEIQDPSPMKWGSTVSFSTFHGNPGTVAKKVYEVEGLLGRYSGDWVMTKVTHVFDTKYTNTIELNR